MPKSAKVSARISDRARRKLDRDAARARLTRSRYIEGLILGRRIIVIDGLDDFLPALKQSGKNLHQILVRLNTGQIFAPEVGRVRQTYEAILRRLLSIQRGEGIGNHQDEPPEAK